jgi:hypothetical protein
MFEIILIKNPFSVEREYDTYKATGLPLTSYMQINWEAYEAYKNGHFVANPERCYPLNGEQYVITPHVGGHGFKRIFGMVLMIGLMIAAPHINFGLSSMFARSLVSGAVMILGGKLINSMLHLNQVPQVEVNNSQSYGWDLPAVQTQEGNTIGETFGECIPAPQLLMCHIETVDDDTQYLNVLYCGGYGPVDSISDLRIGYTPIENFSNCQIEKRLGTNDQTPISFFPNTVADQSIDLTLKEGNGVVRSTDSDEVNKIEVTVTFPSGIYYQKDNGNFGNQKAHFQISYRVTGTSAWTTTDYSLTKKTNQAVRKTYSFDNLTANRYDVKVTAIDTPLTNRRCALMQWSTLSAFIYTGAFIRPNKVLVAMRVKATSQLNGGVPSLTWTQKREYVWVYDANTNGYTQKSAYNPIWAAYDILHHCRKLKNINTGGYEFIVDGTPKERFTMYWNEWVDAAAYADEMVETTGSTKEKRFQIDAIFDTSMKRLEAANKAASVGHAVIIQHGTQFGIAVDKPGVMRQIFGEGRTLMSSLSGSFSSLDDRARSIQITYNDRDNDFKNTPFFIRSARYAQDVELQDNTPELQLFGVSRRSQAYREGIYTLATNERQLETVTFSADINAIVCEYGDIIGINHSVAKVGMASGRIIAVDGNIITLDKEVSMEDGEAYGVKIQLSANDHIISRDVKAVAGSTTKVMVTEAFDVDDAPVKYDTYAIGAVDKIVQPFRITKVEKDGDEKVSLTCVQYDEAIYEVDYNRYPVIDYSATDSLRAPVDLKIVEQAERNYAGVKIDNLIASWRMPGNSRYDNFRVYYSTDGISWESCGSTTDMQMTIQNVDPMQGYRIRVSAVLDGIESQYTQAAISLTGNIQPAVEPENITAYTRYRKLMDGTDRYDIVVNWGPDNLTGRLYYKPNHVQADQLVFQEGVSADDLGWVGPWTLAGTGSNQYTIPQCVPGDTYRVTVCTANELGEYTTPDNSPHLDVLCAARTTTPNTPDEVSVDFGKDRCTVTWSAVTNTDIAFYELRIDTDAGSKTSSFLLRTNSLKSDVKLTERAGRIYVFACGTDGKYSAAAEVQYNKPEPPKPDAPILAEKLGGMRIEAGKIPSDCLGMNVYINDQLIYSVNNTITYTCAAGIYDVTIAYVDIFGEGEKSESSRCTVKVKVSQELLDSEAVSIKNVDKALAEYIDKGVAANNSVIQLVKNLNTTDGASKYSALVQLIDSIELRVKNDEVISKINISPETITIDGKYIHCTGDTVFDKNIIAKGMIQSGAVTTDNLEAGAVTAKQMTVNSLSAICATIGTLRTKTSGSRVEIHDNLIEVYDDNNTLRVRMGVW